jgi:hypothetical protein
MHRLRVLFRPPHFGDPSRMSSLRFLALTCLLGAALPLVGCGSTTLSTTGPAQPSREVGCDFQVFTVAPGDGYVEIGTIDVSPGGWGANTYRKLPSFKEKVQPYVCRAGGDAVLALANGYGMYIKATILKGTGASASGAASQGAAGGCRFDTQCKGDRICVKGECVEPEKK